MPGPAIDNGQIKATLKEVASCAPRFLFRGWSNLSGGCAALNTVDAITPRAFLNGGGPKTIDDIPAEEIRTIWNAHFDGEVVDTIFSSWSHSPYALSVAMSHDPGAMATERPGSPVPSAYISILDTTKLLPQNQAYFTAAPALTSSGFAGGVHEFLLFGPVSGSECLRSVSVAEFRRLGETSMPVATATPYEAGALTGAPATFGPDFFAGGAASESELGTKAYRDEISVAHDLGRLFGDRFELPATCYILSQRVAATAPTKHAMTALARKVAEMCDGMSDEFAEDEEKHLGNLEPHSMEHAIWASFPDAQIALRLLSAVSKLKNSSGDAMELDGDGGNEMSAGDQEDDAEEDDEVMKDVDDEGNRLDGDMGEGAGLAGGDRTAAGPPGTERLTAEQRKLFIDLTGWQNPAELARKPSATRSGKQY